MHQFFNVKFKSVFVFFIASIIGFYSSELSANNSRIIFQGVMPWCWAAASGMALEHQSGVPVELCRVAAYVKGLEPRDCCSFWGVKKSCDTGGNPKHALSALGMWGDGAYIMSGIEGEMTPARTQKIVQAIRSNRPVLATLRRYDETTKKYAWHAVELRGIVPSKEEGVYPLFFIADSARGLLKVYPKDYINLMEYGVLETLYVGTRFSGNSNILDRVSE